MIDGHESHVSAEFQAFYKEKNIITVSIPPHSSHLLQLLDVKCFGPLKRAYGREIEGFMKAHVNHITKAEFLIAFQAAFAKVFTPENVKAGFSGAGLLPLDPEKVLSKLDVKLSTPSPTGSLPIAAVPWASQTPHNPIEATSQTDFIKSRVRCHQGSSPTPILSAVDQFAKRRRAKKTHLRQGGTLSIGEGQDILDQKDVNAQLGEETRASSSRARRAQPREQRCGICGNTGHNARTCEIDIETS